MKTWFTADTHFGQERTLELSKRPFTSVEHMDKEIIRRWNSVVGNDDEVYHLGDFGDPDTVSRLKFKTLYLVRGNYDDDAFCAKLDNIFSNSNSSRTLVYLDSLHTLSVGGEGVEATLVHQPVHAKDPSLMYLFGHIHNTQKIKRNGLNVGTDCHNFTPVDTDYILFQFNGIINHYDENVFIPILGSNLW